MTEEYMNELRLSTVNTPIFVAYSGSLLPNGKIDKAPINAKNGRPASNTKSQTWALLEQAKAFVSRLHGEKGKPGVGVVMGQPMGEYQIAGIDLDGCLDENGSLKPWAKKIVALAPSYTEISPSGLGVKIFFLVRPADIKKLREAMDSKHKKAYPLGPHCGAEIHLSNSYFTITWQEFGVEPAIIEVVGIDDRLRHVPLANLRQIIKLAEAFAREGRRKSGGVGQVGQSGRPLEDVRAALFAIPNDGSLPENDDRQWWLEIGMALHHEFNGALAGLNLFQEWSAKWPGYDPDATETAWKSFRKEG